MTFSLRPTTKLFCNVTKGRSMSLGSESDDVTLNGIGEIEERSLFNDSNGL